MSQRSQSFPLMLAVMAILLIIAMMVVNVGKVAVFRTDTSNAADAGALAAASVLSQVLLGEGLNADKFAARSTLRLAAMVYMLCNSIFPFDMISAWTIYMDHCRDALNEYKRLFDRESVMGWANAKKTGLQYAFLNIGADQPPAMKYKEYKLKGYSGNYTQYRKDMIEKKGMQSGFVKFMTNPGSGYASPIGAIGTSMPVPAYKITSGFGWLDGDQDSYGGQKYADWPNFVEAQVRGNQYYSIWVLTFPQYFGMDNYNYVLSLVQQALANKYQGQYYPPFADYIYSMLYDHFTRALWSMPVTFSLNDPMTGDDEEKKQTDDNPIAVKTKRFRKNDLQMWEFDYDGIISRATSRAFRDKSDTTADALFKKEKVKEIVTGTSMMPEDVNLYMPETYNKTWFDDQDRHLFETELTDVR